MDLQPFGGCDDRRIDRPERKIAVLGDQLGDAKPVRRRHWFGDEVAGRDVTKEADFGIHAEASAQQVGHLGDHEFRDQEGTCVRLEELQALGMVSIVRVDVGVQGPGVDDQRDPGTSAASISSIRSETSERPLWPAAAASSRRRPRLPPRSDSIASRVSSEMVVPRRSASCRKRASSSSGSLTVVRFMVCQHIAPNCRAALP